MGGGRKDFYLFIYLFVCFYGVVYRSVREVRGWLCSLNWCVVQT